MNRLKAEVEKIVGGVVAGETRKDRIREELYAHLHCLYEDGLLGGRDESEAVEAALGRFGRPDEIRSELQAGVPLVERLLFTPLPLFGAVERRFRAHVERDADESPVRFAARTSVALGALTLALYATVYAVARVLPAGGSVDLDRAFRVGLSMTGFLSLNLVAYLWFAHGLARGIGEATAAARWDAWTIRALCLGALAFASGIGFSILSRPYLDFAPAQVVALAWIAAAIPVSAALSAAAMAAERRRQAEWRTFASE